MYALPESSQHGFNLKKKNEYFDAGGSHGLDGSEQNIGKIKVKSSQRQTRTSE